MKRINLRYVTGPAGIIPRITFSRAGLLSGDSREMPEQENDDDESAIHPAVSTHTL
jgi:hypothetical protein